MNRQERQQLILSLLRSDRDPVRGDDLAQRLQVTRQVVVHEIALMRASGIPIVSTPRGYLLGEDPRLQQETIIAVRHDPEQTVDELYTLVDHGLMVHSVIVAHPLYGHLEGSLELRSRLDVETFLSELQTGHAALLSSLTEGYHLHRVSFSERSHLERAKLALRECGVDVLD